MKNIISTLFLSKPGLDRRREEKKKFLTDFCSYLTRAIKFSKKFKKLKNLIPTIFLSKPGLDRPWKRKKKFRSEFCSYLTEHEYSKKKKKGKISKNSKTLFRQYFYPKQVDIGQERVKKIFFPNTVPNPTWDRKSQ